MNMSNQPLFIVCRCEKIDCRALAKDRAGYVTVHSVVMDPTIGREVTPRYEP
jgi:hypothetical protein